MQTKYVTDNPVYKLNNVAVKRRCIVTVRDIYSSFMAIIPIISIYNVPLVGLGFSTVLLGAFAPYAFCRFLKRPKLGFFFPFLALMIYIIFRSLGDWVNIFLMFIVVVHVLGTSGNSISIDKMRFVIELVAIFASVLVIIQTLIYYILHIRTNLLIGSFILSDLQFYFDKANVGLFRPSAIFLEPSHFTQYCSVALISTLLPSEGKPVKIKQALFIAFGCLCTTSGMGIALCFGAFAFYFFKRSSETKFGTKVTKIIGGLFILAAMFAVMMQFSFFSTAVQRVFGVVDGYNAIWGRTLFWNSTVGTLSGSEKWFGVGAVQGNLNTQNKYITGLMKVIYFYGYFGLTLLALMFLRFYVRAKKNQIVLCLSLAYCGLLVVANLFSFLSLSFWMCFLYSEISRYRDFEGY